MPRKLKRTSRRILPALRVRPSVGLHMDVDLALINVTVTDPYNRLVTELDPDNSAYMKTTSSRK